MKNDLVILLIGTTVMFLTVGTLIIFAYFYQKKLNKKNSKNKELEDLLKREELKSAYALIEGQDIERERVAQDLHDRLGGHLSTIQIYLDLLMNTELSKEQQKHLTALNHASTTSIQEVRSIAHALSSSSLILHGLEKGIEHLCQVVNDSKRIEAKSFISIIVEIHKELAMDIYQIIQELITNTLKHANASLIRIDLTAIQGEVNLIYQDNGKGFDINQLSNGIGLNGLKLRVEKHQGNINIETKKGEGVTFILEIPC